MVCASSFRSGLGGLAMAAVFFSAPGAFASPATESDLTEIHDGVFSANATVSYQSSHVFRGVRQAADNVQLKLKSRFDTGLVDIQAGAVAIRPTVDQYAGIDEPTEVDIFASARFDLLGLFVAEAGATYYLYPDAEDTGDANPRSFEVFAGIDLPVIIPVLIRAYYDVDYDNTTIETKGRWRQAVLGERLELEVNSVIGYVHTGDNGANENAALAGARTLVQDQPQVAQPFDAQDHRFYAGIGAAASTRIGDHVKIGANVNWQGTTGEYVFDGETDDETLWGGASITVGF